MGRWGGEAGQALQGLGISSPTPLLLYKVPIDLMITVDVLVGRYVVQAVSEQGLKSVRGLLPYF